MTHTFVSESTFYMNYDPIRNFHLIITLLFCFRLEHEQSRILGAGQLSLYFCINIRFYGLSAVCFIVHPDNLFAPVSQTVRIPLTVEYTYTDISKCPKNVII